jgi:hypothetical protein
VGGIAARYLTRSANIDGGMTSSCDSKAIPEQHVLASAIDMAIDRQVSRALNHEQSDERTHRSHMRMSATAATGLSLDATRQWPKASTLFEFSTRSLVRGFRVR